MAIVGQELGDDSRAAAGTKSSPISAPEALTTFCKGALALVAAARRLLESATYVVDFPLPSEEELRRQSDLGAIPAGESDHLLDHESEGAAVRHLEDETKALVKAHDAVRGVDLHAVIDFVAQCNGLTGR